MYQKSAFFMQQLYEQSIVLANVLINVAALRRQRRHCNCSPVS